MAWRGLAKSCRVSEPREDPLVQVVIEALSREVDGAYHPRFQSKTMDTISIYALCREADTPCDGGHSYERCKCAFHQDDQFALDDASGGCDSILTESRTKLKRCSIMPSIISK